MRVGTRDLVELAGVAVDHQHVAVAARLRPTLDRRVRAQRVAAPVGLAGVLEPERDPARVPVHHLVGNADRPALVEARAEVGVEAGVAPDRRDDRGGVRQDRQFVDAPVPRVVRREHRAPRRARHGMAAGTGRGDRSAESGDQRRDEPPLHRDRG